MNRTKSQPKNRTIVAIAVHHKFDIGDNYWYCESNGKPHPIKILSRPYYRAWVGGFGGAWWIDIEFQGIEPRKYEESCGDAGMFGFTHDTRPCRIVKDLPTANERVKEIFNWQKRTRSDRPICG